MVVSFDAVVGNFDKIRKQVSDVLSADKKSFALIIDKNLSEIFDQSIRSIERDLSLEANSLADFDKANAAKKVLKDNFITVNSELFDSIGKDISLFLTNVELNNIPFTNAGLKREVRKIFDSKLARLGSQVVTESTRTNGVAKELGFEKSGVITHKIWVAVVDDRTTNICLGLNGQIREIGEPFSTGDFQPPAHINCRSDLERVSLAPKR